MQSIRALLAPIPRAACVSHVRPSRGGYRPVVTVFRDGKIARSVYGDLNRSAVGAAVTAELAAQVAQHEADLARRTIIAGRIAATCIPILFLTIGALLASAVS